MLLLHQAGSVKVGEVIRYTITYTPSNDRILPTPSHIHIKVKNTSALPLRAAWVHGPYCLHVSAYPATFNPYQKTENPERDGVPHYEPVLKASGSWMCRLTIPEDIRETGADLGTRRSLDQAGFERKKSVTWIVEIASQILFSNSAAVHFELLAGRDERSLELGFAAVAGHGHGGPGKVECSGTEQEKKKAREKGHAQTDGVYSKAVKLVVEDTDVLWDKPTLPTAEDLATGPSSQGQSGGKEGQGTTTSQSGNNTSKPRKKKKIHLVVLTHGLHSNIGTDMLFLKESIDATVKQARLARKKYKEKERSATSKSGSNAAGEHGGNMNDQHEVEKPSTAPLFGGQQDLDDTENDSDDDEATIVRGFTGNAVKTENGIQYLGKRLAKYILRYTYPDQSFLPVKKPLSKTLSDKFKSEDTKAKRDGMPSHLGSSVHQEDTRKVADALPYTFTSISFIGHSLGGLIQTYAMAYIHKHNPDFFTQITPVNFICMASPMLGLSNENPMYVKFALDFGLVGRTGQDLGLTWRAPSALAKGGWNAMLEGFSTTQKEPAGKAADPSSKPLLRVLPTGPAHQVLRMFRNRTVYSNVVNDGIVPLRTSCLLFLDWKGLGKVDKARRENGLIGTVAEWGWAEITGQNYGAASDTVGSAATRGGSIAAATGTAAAQNSSDDDEDNEQVHRGDGEAVPQPDEDETGRDNMRLTTRNSYDTAGASRTSSRGDSIASKQSTNQQLGMWDSFVNFFKAKDVAYEGSQIRPSKKTAKAIRRGQTKLMGGEDSDNSSSGGGTTTNPTMRPHLGQHKSLIGTDRPQATRGDSSTMDEAGELQAPPKTSIFESAGDMLHPPLPSRDWIVDPSNRTRTIFHDRVYHPDDIPPPPPKQRSSRGFNFGSENNSKQSLASDTPSSRQDSVNSNPDLGGMKVEEKIARAYHRDLSWRKVLVRLEPDAHNNMIVRRMFANAYGWPVIKHLCDTHFADTYAAQTRDEHEPARERATEMSKPKPEVEEEVEDQTSKHVPERSQSELREAGDELAGLETSRQGIDDSYSSKAPSKPSRQGTETSLWDDEMFDGTDDDGSDVDERSFVQRMINPVFVKKPEPAYQSPVGSTTDARPATPSQSQPFTDGHRGLSPTTLRSSKGASSELPGMPVYDSKLSNEPASLSSPTEATFGGRVPSQAGSSMGEGGDNVRNTGSGDGIARVDALKK